MARRARGLAEPAYISQGMERLAADLSSGAWDAKYGALRSRPAYAGSLRLVVTR